MNGHHVSGQNTIEKTIDKPRPGDYTIECDGEVENEFIRIEKPHE